VAAVRAELGPDVVLKAILETGELDDDRLIARAANLALDGGADFLKTSTGKTARSATPEAARVLLSVLTERAGPGGTAGIKISGGVGTTEQAGVYLAMADEAFGADRVSPATMRFGASGLLTALLADLG
jgi:deoxyribose-phosphate aldolase